MLVPSQLFLILKLRSSIWTSLRHPLLLLIITSLVVLPVPHRLLIRRLGHVDLAFFANHGFQDVGIVAKSEALLAHLYAERHTALVFVLFRLAFCI